MLASLIIFVVGYSLSLIMMGFFGVGLLGLTAISMNPLLISEYDARLTRIMLFVCGPLAIAGASITRALV